MIFLGRKGQNEPLTPRQRGWLWDAYRSLPTDAAGKYRWGEVRELLRRFGVSMSYLEKLKKRMKGKKDA